MKQKFQFGNNCPLQSAQPFGAKLNPTNFISPRNPSWALVFTGVQNKNANAMVVMKLSFS